MLVDLVVRARAGDNDAFTELVRRFQDAVYGTAYGRVLDRDAALDIAQETFVRAYEALPGLRSPEGFTAWLMSICRRLSADWRRSPERGWVRLDDTPCGADPAAIALARDTVRRALGSIPADNRVALTLWLVDGYTYQEVAELTDVPLSTAKGRIHRARQRIRKEALAMAEEALKQEAPNGAFTLDTVRRCVERARQLQTEGRLRDAVQTAQRALADLRTAPEADEARELHMAALDVMADATYLRDEGAWAKAVRERLGLAERAGDREAIARHLCDLALYDRSLTEAERQAMRDQCLGMWTDLGATTSVAQELLFRAAELLMAANRPQAAELLAQAKEVLAGHPYNGLTAALTAVDDALAEADRHPGNHEWAKLRAVGTVDHREAGRLLSGGSGAGLSSFSGPEFADGFERHWFLGWYPLEGPAPGFEETKDTFSFGFEPTRTAITVDLDPSRIETPAGGFRDCLVLRAEVTDPGTEDDERARRLNRRNAGRHTCWFARGVGPVLYESENGRGEHTRIHLLSYEGPEGMSEWIPIAEGVRWEYAPVEMPEGVAGKAIRRITHIAEDGTIYMSASGAFVRTGM